MPTPSRVEVVSHVLYICKYILEKIDQQQGIHNELRALFRVKLWSLSGSHIQSSYQNAGAISTEQGFSVVIS